MAAKSARWLLPLKLSWAAPRIDSSTRSPPATAAGNRLANPLEDPANRIAMTRGAHHEHKQCEEGPDYDLRKCA